jgi:hypothetical protein
MSALDPFIVAPAALIRISETRVRLQLFANLLPGARPVEASTARAYQLNPLARSNCAMRFSR